MITKAYFLIGSQYVRYDVASDQVDAGYPKPIGANWPGFSAAGVDTGVDAAVDGDDEKVYVSRARNTCATTSREAC